MVHPKAVFGPTQWGEANYFGLAPVPTFGQRLEALRPSKVLGLPSQELNRQGKTATTRCGAKAAQHFAQRWRVWDRVTVSK